MFKSLALDHYVLYSQAKLMAFSFVSLKKFGCTSRPSKRSMITANNFVQSLATNCIMILTNTTVLGAS